MHLPDTWFNLHNNLNKWMLICPFRDSERSGNLLKVTQAEVEIQLDVRPSATKSCCLERPILCFTCRCRLSHTWNLTRSSELPCSSPHCKCKWFCTLWFKLLAFPGGRSLLSHIRPATCGRTIHPEPVELESDIWPAQVNKTWTERPCHFCTKAVRASVWFSVSFSPLLQGNIPRNVRV